MTEIIVVGVDGSKESLAALRWASDLAAGRDATVRAVLVWSLLDQHPQPGERFDPGYDDAAALADLDQAVTAELGDAAAAVERHVTCDLPVDGLLTAGLDADLLVVGARGRGGFKGLLLGSVSRKVLERATVPVAVVRGPAPGAGGRVLVGVDGSASSMAALRWAAHEAGRRGATLAVLHAWSVPWPVDLQAHAMVLATMEEQAKKTLAAAVAAVPDDVKVEGILLEGGAAASLLEASRSGTELLVVASRGRSGPLASLLGSVSHHLASHAPVPLVVLPPVEVRP